MKQRIVQREAEDAARYKKYYDIDHREESQYDFVIDTTAVTAEQAAAKILEYIKKKK